MKDIQKIEMLLEVAEAINSHKFNLRSSEIDINIYRSIGYDNATEIVIHNIAVIERLLLILEKKYNRILKQLNDEC